MALMLQKFRPAHGRWGSALASPAECKGAFPKIPHASAGVPLKPGCASRGSVNYWLLVCVILLLMVILGAPILYGVLDRRETGPTVSTPPQARHAVSEKIVPKPQVAATAAEEGSGEESAGRPAPVSSPSDLPAKKTPSGKTGAEHEAKGSATPLSEPRESQSRVEEKTGPTGSIEESVPHVSAPADEGTSPPPVRTAREGSVVVERKGKPAAQGTGSEAQPGPASAPTRYVRVKAGNVRAGPSLAAEVKFRIHRGDAVKVTQRQENWCAIALDDGRTGWAHHTLFSSHSSPASRKDPGQVKNPVKEIRAIRPLITADNRTGVIFELNGYYPPETKILDGTHPRLVCDFPDTRLNSDIPRQKELNSGHIERIRIGIHGQPQSKVRVVMDFRPGRDYTIEQLFYKKENYYTLMVSARKGSADSPPGERGVSEGQDTPKAGITP